MEATENSPSARPAVRALERLAQDRVDPVAAADRHGRLVDHDGEVAADVPADALRGRAQVLQVGVAVRQRRGLHGDEDHLGAGHRLGVVGGEGHPLGRLGEQRVHVRLVDRRPPGPQHLDLGLVEVDAGHVVAEEGQADAGGEADVARSDDAHLHREVPFPSRPLHTVTHSRNSTETRDADRRGHGGEIRIRSGPAIDFDPMLTMQDALARLHRLLDRQGCLTVQPMNTEVGAGTLNPATFLRVLGPEPWRVVYVEPSVRPDDSRYGENPNRIQTHTQFQVILKPEPGNPQELYLGSLAALGIDVAAHDVRFVEDNWASPALGAWGLGWEVWLDGLEITQFTYFQQAGGLNLDPPSVEITYGIERILMALQGVTALQGHRVRAGRQLRRGVRPGRVRDVALLPRRRRRRRQPAAARAVRGRGAAADRRRPAGARAHLRAEVLARVQRAGRPRRGVHRRAGRRVRPDAPAGRRRGAELWMARREELGHPLGVATPPPPRGRVRGGRRRPSRRAPRHAGLRDRHRGDAAGRGAARPATRCGASSPTRLGGTRLGARRGPGARHPAPADRRGRPRWPPGRTTTCARSAARRPTRRTAAGASQGFARVRRASRWTRCGRADVNGVPHLVVRAARGRPAPRRPCSPRCSRRSSTGLRSAKNMRWNDPQLAFTRPIRWLLALWGDEVVPVAVSALAAGRRDPGAAHAARPGGRRSRRPRRSWRRSRCRHRRRPGGPRTT